MFRSGQHDRDIGMLGSDLLDSLRWAAAGAGKRRQSIYQAARVVGLRNTNARKTAAIAQRSPANLPVISPQPAEQAFSDRAVVRFASGQQNCDEASFSICECVDLRVAPSARAANSLLLLPPFPPAASRW